MHADSSAPLNGLREETARFNAEAWNLRHQKPQAALELASRAYLQSLRSGDSAGLANALLTAGFCQWCFSNYETAQQILNHSLMLFEAQGDGSNAASVLHTLGLAYIHGDPQQAITYFLRSGKWYEAHGKQGHYASTLNDLGAVHFFMADYALSLDYHNRALELARAAGDAHSEGSSLNGLACVYAKLGEFNNALECFEQSYQVMYNTGRRHQQATTMNNIGEIHKELGRYEDALKSYQISLKIDRELDDLQGEAVRLANIAETYILMGNIAEAADLCRKSLSLAQRIRAKGIEAEDWLMLAELEIKQSEHRTAEEKRTSAQLATGYLNHALAAAEGNHSQEVACRAHKTYADAYRLAGDYERALEQYEKFHELQRKIFAQEIQQKAKILQARFETEKAKKEADLQQAKAEAEHLRNVELAGVNQQLEESNRRLTEADQLKTDLLGIAAHDLKNPLQSILGFAELISARTAGDAKVAGYAKTIEQTAVRMFKTVVDLLQSSAIDSGVIVLQREIIDVTDLIAYIAESNMIHAAKKDQRIDFPAQQICVVNADAERLHEVIDNLIGNAIKFSPRGKTIWVKVEKRDEKVCVSVRDEGLGMDAEDLKKIFGKFRKLSARPTGSENSTGLGLFIAKQLIDLHGGKIWVESKGKDQGTTFTVELPAVIS